MVKQFQGSIEEAQHRAREAEAHQAQLDREKAAREQESQMIIEHFEENTAQLEEDENARYEGDRAERFKLLEDASPRAIVELHRDMQDAEREHQVTLAELRKEKMTLTQTYDQELAAQREAHRAEAETWKAEEAAARAQLDQLRKDRDEMATQMQEESRSMLDDFSSQIAEIKGQQRNHEEERRATQERHEAAVAEIQGSMSTMESDAAKRVREANERAERAKGEAEK
eukprot:COSAG06_NODE_21511_length_754_cov_1.633588_1_plen_227_part_01